MKKVISLILVIGIVISSLVFTVSAQTNEIDFAAIKTGATSDSGYQSFSFVDSNGDEYEFEANFDSTEKPIDFLLDKQTLPESYDARNDGYITSVKSQGNSGTCWSFSAMSALETSSIVQGLSGSDIDYSEAHHIWFNERLLTEDTSDLTYGDGYNSSDPYTEGGNWLTSIRSLTKWSGIANEREFPFYPYNLSAMGDYEESERYNRNSGAVLKSAEKLLDNSDVKSWIKENGSATADFWYDDKYFYNNESYYCYDSGLSVNHQITIVGWDDTYSFSNFDPANQPSASGAWLCKNSWSTGWGNEGYFWLSYMDKSLTSFVGFTSQSAEKYNKNYTYNGAGWNVTISNTGSASIANVFKTSQTEETLSAISLYLVTPGQELNIDIYTDLPTNYSTPVAGTLAMEYTTTVKRDGYHTIELPGEVSLSPDSYFSVVVELVNDGGTSYVTAEADGIGSIPYSSQKGQSFVCLPQYFSSWKDVKNVALSGGTTLDNTCIQAFTKCDVPSTEPEPGDTPETGELVNGEIIEFGHYPQSDVQDSTLISELNKLNLTWTYYEYYAGIDYDHPNSISVGSMKRTDLMKYADIEYNGEKYRAVYMLQYRPKDTLLVPSETNSVIDGYDYNLNTVYWFKYEPVTWKVLDAEKGILISEKSIDSQPFNNNQYYINGLFYSDETNRYYADSYEHSSLRIWLNETLLNTAFTENELSRMEKRNGDYVGLLSVTDLTNSEFGFSTDSTEKDTARRADGTSYAFSQGLINQLYGTNWITETAGKESYAHSTIAGVNHGGNIGLNFNTSSCTMGVRPVIKIKNEEETPDKTYTLIVNANGGLFPLGTDTMVYEYKEGDEIAEIPEPSRTGYFFNGWNIDVPAKMPNSNLEIKALWKAKVYYAYFLANGGKFSNERTQIVIEAVYGKTIQIPSDPTREGYIFNGWSPEVGVQDTESSKTFRAVWIPATDTKYTVETYTMNTFGEYEKTVQTFSGTTNATVNAEYSIEKGFALNEAKSVLSGEIAADGSLVLKVYIDRSIFTLTVVADGAATTNEYLYGSMIAEPVAPFKEGYKFIRWGETVPQTMPAENITITAVFEKCYVCPDCGEEILGEDVIDAHIKSESSKKTTVRIYRNTGKKTINYGEILMLAAVVTNRPADATVVWYVDKVKKAEGNTFNLSFESGMKTVEVKLVDKNGNFLKNSSGKDISDKEEVTVKDGFFQRLIAFFKILFDLERTVIQTVDKVS